MRNKIIIFTLFISFSQYATADFLGFGRAFNSLFGGDDTEENQVTGSFVNYCHRKNLSPDLEENAQCANLLCSGQQNSSLTLTNSSIENQLENAGEAKKEFSEIEPKLLEVLHGLEANQRAKMEMAQRKKQQLIESLDQMNQREYQELASEILSDYISNYRWEPESTTPFFYTPSDWSEAQRTGLTSYSQIAWSARDNYPTEINPSLSIEAQREKARELLERAQSIARNNPSDTSGAQNFIDAYIALKLRSIESLEGSELESLVIEADKKLRTYFSIEEDLKIVNHNSLAFCTEEACKSLVKNLIDEKVENEIQMTLARGSDELVRDALRVCQSHFYSTHTTQQSQNDAEKAFAEVLQLYLNVGLKNLSSHSKLSFEQFAKSLRITSKNRVSGTPDEARAHFANQEVPTSFDPEFWFPDNQILLRNLVGGHETPFSDRFDVSSICHKGMVRIGESGYIPFSHEHSPGSIQVGQGSSHHFVRGKHVIAQELGLALSQSYRQGGWSSDSRQFYEVAQACVSSGEHPSTEKDVADLFAFRTFPSPTELFSCDNFEDVANDPNPENYRLVSDNSGAASTPFFRLIQEAINKKSHIPEACREIIRKNQGTIGTEPCI